MLQDLSSRMQGERLPRHPSEIAEEQALGSAGTSRARLISAGDSAPVGYCGFKIHLLRTATLVPGRAPNSSRRLEAESTRNRGRPQAGGQYADLCRDGRPETVFEGQWSEKDFFRQPEVRRSVRWPESLDRGHVFGSANDYAERLLGLHRQYAQWAGLELLSSQVQALEEQVRTARASGACVLSLGWGGGLLTKRPGSTPATRSIELSCSSFRFTIAPSHRASRFPRHAESYFLTTSRQRCPAGCCCRFNKSARPIPPLSHFPPARI